MDVRDYKTFTYIMYKTKVDEDRKKENEAKAESKKRACLLYTSDAADEEFAV